VGVPNPVRGFDIRLLRGGVPVYHQSFGVWSLDRPANTDSSSKTMSGALILAGTEVTGADFSLDSKLADFLPSFDQPEKRDITIRQAFTHTSGIAGGAASSSILSNPNITLQQAANLIAQQPLAYGPPGSKFAYGGLSMQAAGAAMEVAIETPFLDFFEARLVAPMQLTNTRFVLASDSNPRVAGGIESTATDFARFMDMLLNNGIDRSTGNVVLQPASVAAITTRQTNDAQTIISTPPSIDNNRYGIGAWIDQLDRIGTNTVDAMAAGARGFHAWIDRSHDLAFAFSTDVSSFGLIVDLADAMHEAIVAAIDAPLLQGDTNADGRVDFVDLVALSRNYNRSGKLWAEGDFNGDGRVDFADLLALSRNYNLTLSASDQAMLFNAGESFMSDWFLARSIVPEPVMFTGYLGVAVLISRRGGRRERRTR
jgi:CubicO group peptidase (beta-lactamase class C family)